MAVRRETKHRDRLLLTFELPSDEPAGPISVVGSFNDWTPGVHELLDGGAGKRAVTVEVPYDTAVHFRYLGMGGVWFDEPDADELTAMGSLLYPVPAPESPAAPQPADAAPRAAQPKAAKRPTPPAAKRAPRSPRAPKKASDESLS